MAADEDFLCFASNPEELRKYRGMHVAIWNRQVIGYGETAKEAYEEAKERYPESDPMLAYISENEAIIL